MVNKVKVRNVGDNKTSEIPCSGFFAYIGLEPACDFAPPEITRDAGGFLVTDASLQTAIAGVFAAGAVRAGYGGMLTDAAKEAQTAAAAARARLSKQ